MTRHTVHCLLAALVLAGPLACTEPSPRAGAPTLLADEPPAAAPGASTPSLASSPDGTLWISWMERGADSAWTIRVAQRPARGAWSEPRVVVRDSLLFANWADFPAVAAGDSGQLALHYLRRSSPGKYSYHVWVVASADGGLTWSAPQRLHGDTSATEHGFAALVPMGDGTVAAAWLDGHATGTATGAMAVAFGGLDRAGNVRADTILDARTCDCCQVTGVRVSGGVLFAYRDRTAEEVRDIAVVRYVDGRWRPPAIVHDDSWVTRACPVNGPALAARDSGVALAWFTNADSVAAVQVAFSEDRGATWGAPVRVDDGQPLGRVDIEYVGDGAALVTWLEHTMTGSAEVRARRVWRDGARSAAVSVGATSDARQAGFPRTALGADSTVFVAWREVAEPSRLRLGRLEIQGAASASRRLTIFGIALPFTGHSTDGR
jgi:hypothetical protein